MRIGLLFYCNIDERVGLGKGPAPSVGVGLCGLESRNLRDRGARSFPLLYLFGSRLCICDVCLDVIMHGDVRVLLRRRALEL